MTGKKERRSLRRHTRPYGWRSTRSVSRRIAPCGELGSGRKAREEETARPEGAIPEALSVLGGKELMKKFYLFFAMCALASWTLMGCQRNQGVFAGNDSSLYKPRPAPLTDEMQGELLRVNAPGRTVELRVENGLIQTFRYDEHTVVSGLEGEPNPAATGKSSKVMGPLAVLVG